MLSVGLSFFFPLIISVCGRYNIMRNSIKNIFELRVYTYLWVLVQQFLWSSAQLQPSATPVQLTQVLWALGPCQSAFWIPSSSSEFNSNWITYLFEGNPVSQNGECLFTLESDPSTRIEMVIQEVNLFGSTAIQPPPCLTIYDVKANGTIVMLKKECQAMLASNTLESQPTFTETNLAILSSTIRYGSFQLQARAVPRTYGFPTRVSSTTPTTVSTPTTSLSTTPSTTSPGNVTVATSAGVSNTSTTPTVTSSTTTTTTTVPSPTGRLLSDIAFRYEMDDRKHGYENE